MDGIFLELVKRFKSSETDDVEMAERRSWDWFDEDKNDIRITTKSRRKKNVRKICDSSNLEFLDNERVVFSSQWYFKFCIKFIIFLYIPYGNHNVKTKVQLQTQ